MSSFLTLALSVVYPMNFTGADEIRFLCLLRDGVYVMFNGINAKLLIPTDLNVTVPVNTSGQIKTQSDSRSHQTQSPSQT